jgi:hypothetical protein
MEDTGAGLGIGKISDAGDADQSVMFVFGLIIDKNLSTAISQQL